MTHILYGGLDIQENVHAFVVGDRVLCTGQTKQPAGWKNSEGTIFKVTSSKISVRKDTGEERTASWKVYTRVKAAGDPASSGSTPPPSIIQKMAAAEKARVEEEAAKAKKQEHLNEMFGMDKGDEDVF